jgi:cyanate permease
MVCLLAAVVAFRLPEPSPSPGARTTTARPGYLVVLRTGFAEIRHDPRVRGAAVVAGVLPAALVLDEYLPLLARTMGAITTVVPLLVMLAVLAKAFGSYLAGPMRRSRPVSLALVLVIGAALLVVGSLSRRLTDFVAVSVGLGILQLSIVLTQARLQDVIQCDARATVTSATGLITHVATMLFYLAYGVGSIRWDLATLVAMFATVPALIAVVMPHWLPAYSRRSA